MKQIKKLKRISAFVTALTMCSSVILPNGLLGSTMSDKFTVSAGEILGARAEYNASTGDVFLGGNYIEVGVSKHGSFGTEDDPESTDFHPSDVGVGLAVDGDGWNVGNDRTTGDFFLPGSPEERWILSYKIGSNIYEYKVADRMGVLSGTWKTEPVAKNISDLDNNLLKAEVTGTTIHDVNVKLTYSFGVEDLFYLTDVNIQNNGTSDITDVRFVRSFDPDQDQDYSDTYSTFNKVVCNPVSDKPGGEDNYAMVVARGAVTLDGFFFVSFDNRARVSHGVNFKPNSAYLDGLWDETSSVTNTYATEEDLTLTPEMVEDSGIDAVHDEYVEVGGYTLEDNAIAITFNLDSLAAGTGTTDLNYYSSLSPDVIASIQKIKEGVSGKVNYLDEVINELEPEKEYTISVPNGDKEPLILDVVASQDGTVPLVGKDTNEVDYNLLGKKITITPVVEEGEEADSQDIDILDHPAAPDDPVVPTETVFEKPDDVKVSDIETTETTVKISKPVNGQEYSIDDGETWQKHTGTETIQFTDLTPNTKYTVITRIAVTPSSPCSLSSAGVDVYTKPMLKNLNISVDGSSTIDYDGKDHSRSISVSDSEGPVDDAAITYSLNKDSGYTSEPIKVKENGVYTIYYCITKDGFYPAYGSFNITVKTHEHVPAETWSTDDTAHWKECLDPNCTAKTNNDKPSYGEHTFTIVKDEKYLVSKADCEHGSKYRPVCSVCGKIDEDDSHIFEDTDCLNTTTHTHEIEKVEAKNPDCLHDGNAVYYRCKTCGRTFYTEGNYEIGHNGDEHIVESYPRQSPTCTECGYTAGTKCTVCEEWITGHNELPATGHLYDDTTKSVIKEATCTEDGLMQTYCRKCCKYIDQVIPKKGHTVVEVAEVPATCTEKGCTAGTKCSVCGEILSGCVEIPALTHTVVEVAEVPATCTEKGCTAGTKCSVCNEILSGCEETPALGHTEEIIPAVEATCTHTGLTEGKKCSVCKEIIEPQQVIPMKDHYYGEKGNADPQWTWTTDENGIWKAIVTFKCQNCDRTYTFTPRLEITNNGDKAQLFAEQLFEEHYYSSTKEVTNAAISFSYAEPTKVDGVKRISFKYNWSAVEGFDIVKYGVLYNKDGSITTPTETGFVLGGTGVKATSKTNTIPDYSLNVDINGNENLTVHTRGYIVVKDKNGKQYTYYSKIVSKNYGDLLGKININDITTITSSTTNKISYHYNWSALEGYEVVKYGALYKRANSLSAFDDTKDGAFEDRFILGASGVGNTTKTNQLKDYTLNVSVTDGQYVATRGYLVVKDSAGINHTIYGDISEGCFNDFK